MDTNIIYTFLRNIAANNNRDWFHAHRDEYDAARASFGADIECAIAKIAEFDASIAHLTLKDVTYRFNRDTRFSPDKAPYKRHFCAYISAHGRKALHGGYYIHMEPNNCLLACGTYWLPTNILTSCRNEIMGNINEWRTIVESNQFVRFFGKPAEGEWGADKGFGIEHLKTCPSGFPRDYEFIDYLRMKDYCCWKKVPDTFFDNPHWIDEAIKVLKVGKPMMDFINNVVDDYE